MPTFIARLEYVADFTPRRLAMHEVAKSREGRVRVSATETRFVRLGRKRALRLDMKVTRHRAGAHGDEATRRRLGHVVAQATAMPTRSTPSLHRFIR
jgi:hypothetical protein